MVTGKLLQSQQEQSLLLADRKSVVQGKSVDLGGRRIIKKKKKRQKTDTQQLAVCAFLTPVVTSLPAEWRLDSKVQRLNVNTKLLAASEWINHSNN